MTDKQTPADWILLEAAKRGGLNPDAIALRGIYNPGQCFAALCDMIERYEQPPVDRKLLCAREALSHGSPTLAEAITEQELWACVRAIELWEEEFEK